VAAEENRVDRTNVFLAGIAIVALAAAMLGFIFWVLQDQLIYAWRIVRYYQYSATAYIPFIGPSSAELPALLEFLRTTPSKDLFVSTMWEIDQTYGRNFGFLLASIFLLIGYRRISNGKGSFGPELNVESVIDALAPLFPHLQYVKDNSAVGKSIKWSTEPGADNRFAMPLQVFEFAEMAPTPGLERLLTPEQLKEARPIYLKDEKDFFAAFDESMARKAFEAQMGKPLTTPKDFSEEEKLAYNYFRKKLEAKIPAAEVKGLILRLSQKHGFVRTFLMSLFEEAKRVGIVTANDELLPIMDRDRALYWCLDSVGRDTPWIEAAGPYVHKDMEDLVGIRITEPEVTEAVQSLKRYLTLDRATEKEMAEASGDGGMD